MNGKLTLAILLSSFNTFAATPTEIISNLDNKLFILSERSEVNNLYGEIKFSNLPLILGNKLVLKDSTNIKTFLYWSKESNGEKFDIEVVGDLSSEVKEHIKTTLLPKIKILVGQKITGYLSKDELIFEGDQIKALDIAGDESNEKVISYKGNSLQIVEKKPSGTITTDYEFKESEFGLLTKNVSQKAFEGIQATESTSDISYGLYSKIPLPNKIETKLSQKLFRTNGDDLEVTRELIEIIEFSDLELNSDKALLWFSRK